MTCCLRWHMQACSAQVHVADSSYVHSGTRACFLPSIEVDPPQRGTSHCRSTRPCAGLDHARAGGDGVGLAAASFQPGFLVLQSGTGRVSGASAAPRLVACAVLGAWIVPVGGRRWSPRRWLRVARRSAAAAGNETSPPALGTCFVLEQVPGKGVGAIAARDIAAGELLLAERPVMSFSDGGGDGSAEEQFDALSDELQQEVMALHDQLAAGGEKTLRGIIASNCYSGSSLGCDGVLLPAISRFNHSCRPNCELGWDEGGGVEHVQVRASADIAAGDELCVYYVDVLAPRPERAQALRSKHVTCACPCCQRADGASDGRRAAVRDLQALLRALVEEGDPGDAERGLQAAAEVLRLLDEEGLQLLSARAQTAVYAFELASMLDDDVVAAKWLQQAYDYSALCNGPEHADTVQLRHCLLTL